MYNVITNIRHNIKIMQHAIYIIIHRLNSTKTVACMRNPKDVLVSFYYHMRNGVPKVNGEFIKFDDMFDFLLRSKYGETTSINYTFIELPTFTSFTIICCWVPLQTYWAFLKCFWKILTYKFSRYMLVVAI